MTHDGWTRDVVANACGWTDHNTVSRMVTRTRAKVRAKQPLDPDDFPLPFKHVGRTPLWDPSDVARFLENRPGKRAGRWGKRPRAPKPASDVQVGDVIWLQELPHLVREKVQGDETISVRVTRSRREAARWEALKRTDEVMVWRPHE